MCTICDASWIELDVAVDQGVCEDTKTLLKDSFLVHPVIRCVHQGQPEVIMIQDIMIALISFIKFHQPSYVFRNRHDLSGNICEQSRCLSEPWRNLIESCLSGNLTLLTVFN